MFEILKKDIKNLFLSPNLIEYARLPSNLRLFSYYYFILFFFLVIFTISIESLTHFFINKPKIIIPKNITFLKVAIIVPIIEEVLFRLVIRVNKLNLFLFVVFSVVSILYESYILPTDVYYIFIGAFLLLLLFKKFNSTINSACEKNNFILLLTYLSCLLFGLFHLSNFKDIDITNIVVIAYLFSHIIAGFVFVLLRLKFGIIASILLHMLINSVAFLMVS